MQIKSISKHLKVSVQEVVGFLKSSEGAFFNEDSELSEQQIRLLKKYFAQRCGSGVDKAQPVVLEDMSVGELASRLQCSVNNLIVEFLKKGVVAAKNQVVKKEKIKNLLDELGIATQDPQQDKGSSLEKMVEIKSSSGTHRRLPIVTVVGHVDHGKTTFLDYLRKSKIADKEKGGITQSVAAYEIETSQGNLVFLDTPGHEAFSLMRERGVLLSDLVVLMIALDDGIKPQTVESIKKIQEFGTTAVVALNKADKAQEDRVDVVKRQLADYGLLPDDWGGDVPCVKISAKTGAGIDELLEVIRLQADILDLKTSESDIAQGFVLESMMEQGRGAVASVILHKGSLCRGDQFICGKAVGKISSMRDSSGKNLDCVKPSVPVIISGFNSLPEAGQMLTFATTAEVKKHRSDVKRNSVAPSSNKQNTADEDKISVSVIIKAATHLSKEALITSLQKLSKKTEAQIKVIEAGIGDINEGNVELAETTNSIIYGLGVKTHKSALSKTNKKTDVRNFDIIYKLLEDIEKFLEDKKKKQIIERELGKARVKAIFNIKSVGTVAGAAVESGALEKGAFVRVYRGENLVGKGTIKTLQKEKTTLSSVAAGNDCAFRVDGFTNWEIGDVVHCYIETTVG